MFIVSLIEAVYSYVGSSSVRSRIVYLAVIAFVYSAVTNCNGQNPSQRTVLKGHIA